MWKTVVWSMLMGAVALWGIIGWIGWISSREEVRVSQEEMHQKDELLDDAMKQLRLCNSQRKGMDELMKRATEKLEEIGRERGGK